MKLLNAKALYQVAGGGFGDTAILHSGTSDYWISGMCTVSGDGTIKGAAGKIWVAPKNMPSGVPYLVKLGDDSIEVTKYGNGGYKYTYVEAV